MYNIITQAAVCLENFTVCKSVFYFLPSKDKQQKQNITEAIALVCLILSVALPSLAAKGKIATKLICVCFSKVSHQIGYYTSVVFHFRTGFDSQFWQSFLVGRFQLQGDPG